MADINNPYQSPQADIAPEKSSGSGLILTENALGYLKAASPWIRFIGILLFVGCGVTVLAGLGVAVSGSMSGLLAGNLGFGEGLAGVAIGLIYIILAALSFFPARFAYKFGDGLRKFFRTGSEQDLELAFKNNKSMWKFFGILAIVNLALIPVGIVIAVVVALTQTVF